MGDHRLNPQVIANQQGKNMIRATDLGDGVALVGFELRPLMPVPGEGEEATVAVGIVAIGGKSSPLSLNVELREVLVTELGRIPIASLKRMLSGDAPAEQPGEAAAQ